MGEYKDRLKDYADEVQDAGEDLMEKTRLPRWLWPLAAFIVIVGGAIVLTQVLG